MPMMKRDDVVAIVVVAALALGACGRREDRGEAAQIAAQVETELKRSGVDSVEVTMRDRIAVLSGIVETEAQRVRAEEIARQSPRVLGVENRLAVQQAPVLTSASDDARTAAHVESLMKARGVHGVHVAIANNEVKVTGTLPRAQHAEIMQVVAREAPPGYRIIDATQLE